MRIPPWLGWLRWPALLLADAYLVAIFLARGLVPESEWWREWVLSPLATVLRLLQPGRDGPAGTVAAGWWGLHGAALAALLWLMSQRRPTYPQPDTASQYGSHGSARWASERELRQSLKATGPGLILGKTGGRYLIHPPDRRSLHNQLVAIFGGSGSRKTRTWVMPNTLHEAPQPHQEKSSLVVTDPKAENYAVTAAVLAKHGYEVRVLNFLDLARSDRWNPLDYVHSTTDAADLAANIVANTANPNRPSKSDPFWDLAEQNTITALVLYVKRHRPPAEQHMASVLELGTEPSPESLDRIFLALDRTDPARRFYRTFLRAEEKVRSGITAGLGARLQLWNSDEVTALTARSDFDLRHLGSGPRPLVLYLIIPDAKPTYAPILAVFWQQVFGVLYEEADRHGGQLPRRVRCRMDEIANCGYIPDFEKKLSTMRSRGVSVEMIWQTLGQMKNRYPTTWSELLGNCDTWLYLGGNDMETAQYVSQKAGTTTIRVHSSGSSGNHQSSSTSDNFACTGRPLLTPDECLSLDPEMAILLRKGTWPARVRKADYTEHPAAREVEIWDHHTYGAPPREEVTITDTAALVAEVSGSLPPPAGAKAGAATHFLSDEEEDSDVEPPDPLDPDSEPVEP